MKTWLFKSGLTLSLLAATFLARSADQPVSTNVPASATGIGPKIQFNSVDYDFGRELAGTMVKHDFVFTNTGDATLQITGVTPGCGCTTIGEWTHEVAPGKTGVIPIQFNSTMYNGSVRKTPSITCNDKAQPRVGFVIHGTVYKALEVTPTFVSLTISPDASQETSATVHILNNDPQPLALQMPTSSAGLFKAEIKTNVPGKDFNIVISTVPPLPDGPSHGLITIGTSAKSTPSIIVPVMADVKPLMLVAPATLTIPAGPITNNQTISAYLRNMGSQPVTLSDPLVDVQGVQAAITATQPGKVFSAVVTFPSGFQMPAGNQINLTIKTDNPRFPVVKVPIKQAMVAAAAVPPPPAPKNVRVATQ